MGRRLMQATRERPTRNMMHWLSSRKPRTLQRQRQIPRNRKLPMATRKDQGDQRLERRRLLDQKRKRRFLVLAPQQGRPGAKGLLLMKPCEIRVGVCELEAFLVCFCWNGFW